jgi:hypothetical protein
MIIPSQIKELGFKITPIGSESHLYKEERSERKS